MCAIYLEVIIWPVEGDGLPIQSSQKTLSILQAEKEFWCLFFPWLG